jgi:hypothetical protein
MCARRFLFLIFFLTLAVVAGAFAIFQFGDRALTVAATPQGHYQPPPPQTGPDYADISNWIARPDLPAPQNPSLWLPADWPPPTPAANNAATFFIHPTTYLERDRWNAPLDDEESRDRAALFVRSQTSAFNGVSDAWAPRYRQAAFGAFLLDSKDARQALDLAYSDVARAFDAFVAKIPPGKPIILAGHSQGALHLSRLLKEKVAGKPIAKRIVAAYVVGWPLSRADDIPAIGLPACRSANEAGCILSWQSFAEPANTALISNAYEKPELPGGGHRKRADLLCTNPISGTIDGAAPPSANLGTLVPSADLTSATLAVGQVGAHCENGFLLINGAIPALGPYVLPGNNYHVYDYALFWGSIRADAERRLAAFRG